MKAAMGLVATGLLLATAGCLEPLATSYGAAPNRFQPQPVDYAPPSYQPSPYEPAPYQPPRLSPNLTPETVPIPAVGSTPPVRYLPPPAPSASLLVPAPAPPTSLFGSQRAGWN